MKQDELNNLTLEDFCKYIITPIYKNDVVFPLTDTDIYNYFKCKTFNFNTFECEIAIKSLMNYKVDIIWLEKCEKFCNIDDAKNFAYSIKGYYTIETRETLSPDNSHLEKVYVVYYPYNHVGLKRIDKIIELLKNILKEKETQTITEATTNKNDVEAIKNNLSQKEKRFFKMAKDLGWIEENEDGSYMWQFQNGKKTTLVYFLHTYVYDKGSIPKYNETLFNVKYIGNTLYQIDGRTKTKGEKIIDGKMKEV